MHIPIFILIYQCDWGGIFWLVGWIFGGIFQIVGFVWWLHLFAFDWNLHFSNSLVVGAIVGFSWSWMLHGMCGFE